MITQDFGSGAFEILLAHPGKADLVVRAGLRFRDELRSVDTLLGEQSEHARGYRVQGHAALIPITGSLVPRGPIGTDRYGVTSYEAIRAELRRASADSSVRAIILMIDSPGGHVTGIDSTADAILAARRSKPVVAMVEGMAASAAYWLASQADQVVVSPFSEVGSIGAIVIHADISKALAGAGITVTVIRAGAQKADFNPFEPLAATTKAGMQASLERIRHAFAGSVVAARLQPQLDLAAALRSEGAMVDAERAVALGFADEIATLDQLLSDQQGSTYANLRRPVPAESIAARMAGSATPPAVVADPFERGAAIARQLIGKDPGDNVQSGLTVRPAEEKATITETEKDRPKDDIEAAYARGAAGMREMLGANADKGSAASRAVSEKPEKISNDDDEAAHDRGAASVRELLGRS